MKFETFDYERPAVILDTDAFNEVDDQFAIAYLLRSKDRFDIRGITAAPFVAKHAATPKSGMEQSYDEILNICGLMGEKDIPVYKGADRVMTSESDPVASPATDIIISEAKKCAAEGKKLLVLAIGAITNVGSALALEPKLADMMELVWLGGSLKVATEYNMDGDRAAASVVFDSSVPFVQMPCVGVVDKVYISKEELAERVKNCGAVGEYLLRIVDRTGSPGRVIWDIVTVAAFNVPGAFEYEVKARPTIVPGDDYGPDRPNTEMIVAVDADRDVIFNDLFKRISN